ncbi:enoyl-CoA hydratase/isomerase family protein [Yinghuangia aomiensis]
MTLRPGRASCGDRYDFTHFRTELRDNGILWVTFDRPERRNAINPEMHDEIAPLFRRIAADREIRAVVVTGAGEKAFCVGADFSGMQENLDGAGYEDGFPELMHGSVAVVQSQPRRAAADDRRHQLATRSDSARPSRCSCDITLMVDGARIGDLHVHAGLVAGDGGPCCGPC